MNTIVASMAYRIFRCFKARCYLLMIHARIHSIHRVYPIEQVPGNSPVIDREALLQLYDRSR